MMPHDTLTIDEARLRAHQHAMRTDARYRAVMDRISAERAARTEIRPAKRPKRPTRRMTSLDGLPMPRAFFHGPKWRRHFDVQEIPIKDICAESAKLHRPGRKLLIFTFEEDVRERVLEEVRPGVFAMWADPLERLGL